MKKAFIVFCTLILVIVVAAATFIATFDAERYRPLIVTKLESAIGMPAQLDEISLDWSGGLALRLGGLSIFSAPDRSGEPAIHVESASARIRLWPLLQRNVRVGVVTLVRPVVRLTRDHDGTLRIPGINACMDISPTTAHAATTTTAALPLLINLVLIEDGVLWLRDFGSTPPRELQIADIDARLTNVSAIGPIQCQLRLAAFSTQQNISFSGSVVPPSTTHPASIQDVRLEIDTDNLQLDALGLWIPTLEEVGLKRLKGQLVATVDRVDISPAGLRNITGQLLLDGGTIAIAQLNSALERLTLVADVHGDRLELEHLSAHVGDGLVSVTGTVTELHTQPLASIDSTLEGLLLDQLLLNTAADQPQLRGKLSGSFHGTARGVSWPQVSQSLAGDAQVELNDGVVENLNVLREVFDSLSMLPGLVQRLHARLPVEYQAKLEATDTVLEPILLQATASDGIFTFEHFRVATDTLVLEGTGQLTLDGALIADTILRIDPILSAALVRSVQELQALTDESGHLQIPVIVEGTLPQIAIRPDVDYVISHVLATKAQDLIGSVLRKALGEEDTTPQTTPEDSAPTSPASQPVSVFDLLQGVLGGGGSSQESSSEPIR